jgi:hypothetical protein
LRAEKSKSRPAAAGTQYHVPSLAGNAMLNPPQLAGLRRFPLATAMPHKCARDAIMQHRRLRGCDILDSHFRNLRENPWKTVPDSCR